MSVKEYFQCPKCARTVDLNKKNERFGQRCYRCSVLMERVQEEAEPSTLVVEEDVKTEEVTETVEQVGSGDVAESKAVEPEVKPEEAPPVEATKEVVKEEQPAVEEKVEKPVEAVAEGDAVSKEAEAVDIVSDDDKGVEAEKPVEEAPNNLVGEVIEDSKEVTKIIEKLSVESEKEPEVKVTEIMEEE